MAPAGPAAVLSGVERELLAQLVAAQAELIRVRTELDERLEIEQLLRLQLRVARATRGAPPRPLPIPLQRAAADLPIRQRRDEEFREQQQQRSRPRRPGGSGR